MTSKVGLTKHHDYVTGAFCFYLSFLLRTLSILQCYFSAKTYAQNLAKHQLQKKDKKRFMLEEFPFPSSSILYFCPYQ